MCIYHDPDTMFDGILSWLYETLKWNMVIVGVTSLNFYLLYYFFGDKKNKYPSFH